MTQELSSHQALLTELRSLRDADARALQAKSNDVDLLREQVERLAGEVEVLKGVVEEGLKERRMVREQSLVSRDDDDDSVIQEPQTEEFQAQDVDDASEASLSDDQVSPSRTPPRPKSRPLDKNMGETMRTDFATGGSSQIADQPTAPFITSEEIDRISLDLSRRQFSRSASPSLASSTGSQRRPASSLSYYVRPLSPAALTPPERVARPSAPTPAHALNHGPVAGASKKHQAKEEVAAPFPQIRGETLERLFFSAPEHNAHTCNVCQRRRRHEHQAPSWLPSRFAPESESKPKAPRDTVDTDDEGFAEGSEDHQCGVGGKGKGRQGVQFSDGKMPPQTVLARVLRELEDDFTHYKGYAFLKISTFRLTKT